MLCHFDGHAIRTELLLQEPNDMFLKGGYYYWDIERIFRLLKKGVGMAVAKAPRVHSIGVCTWGIDFALFDDKGIMVAPPLAYRNTIGAEEMDALSEGQLQEMYYRTGILSDKINTVFMLKGMQSRMPEVFSRGRKLLMVPDILGYMFTGRMFNEVSEASTTQLLDTRTMEFSPEQCEALGIDSSLFCPVATHGASLGNILPQIREEIGAAYDIPVVCVPSHDTASAVLAAPTEREAFAFISAGTWALIGLHCNEPLITQRALRAELTNEVGAFGHITLLKNSIGMFLIQRLRADYIADTGENISWGALTDLAEGYGGPPLLFDVNHESLFNPERMDKAIGDLLSGNGGLGGEPGGEATWAAIMSAAQYSLGASFAMGLGNVADATGEDVKEVIVLGGGARNQRLMQLTADIAGLGVVACDGESTGVGNALAQAAHVCGLPYADLRRIAAASQQTQTFTPREDRSGLLERYQMLIK
jgi:sugar (pentulose or hexulose) kinase